MSLFKMMPDPIPEIVTKVTEITITPLSKKGEEAAELARQILRYYVANPDQLPEELKTRFKELLINEVK